MRISAHRAVLLAAAAVWVVGGPAFAQDNTQTATQPAAESAPALADVEAKNIVVAQAETGQRPQQVAQLFGTE
ncbi:MAG TPA: hypothetical protein VHM27_05345, partial [Rhizomicrobium sp.]|nr:hypothetical protein [Rhizomicrobium sp.]